LGVDEAADILADPEQDYDQLQVNACQDQVDEPENWRQDHIEKAEDNVAGVAPGRLRR
jgi:hypothetical protein